MEYQLCKEFPALSPFDVEHKTYHEIVNLYARVRDLQIRQNRKEEKQIGNMTAGGDTIIRVPAGDNWF